MPKRCEDCRRQHNRDEQARYRDTLKDHRDTRQVACVNCGAPLTWAGTGRPRQRCTPCLAEWTRAQASVRYREWREANPERAREADRRSYERNAERVRQQKLDEHLRRKYGLERADFDRMVAEQNNRCRICQREPGGNGHHARLHVDHDHVTSRVRGLLCGNCNTMIGLAGDDPKILLAAAEYLTRE